MANDPADMVTLKIPRHLYTRLGQLIDGTGFRSVTEFATYVLRDLVAHPSRAADEDQKKEAQPLTEAELSAIRQRLRELGYL